MIDGEIFKNMITLAAEAVTAQKERLNELNVFPVPDGDTGTNMSLTLNAASAELARHTDLTLGRAADLTSSSLLRGARGNSGVITSLLFRGLTKAMKDLSRASAKDFAQALNDGVVTAYKAVMKPAEGTILTVSRVAAEAAMLAADEGQDLPAVVAVAIEAARHELPNTMELNPVLKKAGVVDAGAYGFIIILEGMQSAITGIKPKKSVDYTRTTSGPNSQGVDYADFNEDDITFAYCTEFIAERTDKKRSIPRFRALLETLGDSVVLVDDDEFIKVHLHTNNPDRALGEALKFGRLSAIKIENMREQFDELMREQNGGLLPTHTPDKKAKAIAIERKYGFVAVAAGDGMGSIFMDLGADHVVSGGQTMNPSTQDILNSVDITPSEVVFVLPNNKNIVMASEQARDLSQKQVVVIPTRSAPQGIASLLAFDADADIETNRQNMTAAAKAVKTGQVTYAARNAEIDGEKINQGDFMALVDDKLLTTSPTQDTVIKKLAGNIADKKSVFITIIYGEGADEASATAVSKVFENEAKHAEINVIYGGQPVYSYIISVE